MVTKNPRTPSPNPWGRWDQQIGSNLTSAPEVPHAAPEGENVMRSGQGGVPTSGKFTKPPKEKTAEQSEQIRGARAGRQRWAKSAAGRARLQTGPQAMPAGVAGGELPVGMLYHLKGWSEQTGVGPSHWDRQLPGLSDPNAAPRPPRWEELPPEARAHTERALSEIGTSVERMGKDFGAQLDQAYLRAEKYRPTVREADREDARAAGQQPPSSGVAPYAEDFYSHGEPRQVIDRSARALGIPQPVHAVLNAITSPQTKFSQQSAGETVYPNNEVAVHVAQHVLEGGTHENISNERRDVPGKSHQGFKTNLRKAAKTMEQHEAGVSPSDWVGLTSKTNPKGKSIWAQAPKTGPYANSWSDTHPQFFVSDVHSGGGGGLPHLSSEKPFIRDESGEIKIRSGGSEAREKSEREKAIASVPYFHSAMDYAARQEMTKRNLGSVRDTQAAQWGEEQLQRNLRSGAKEEQVYPVKRDEVFHESRAHQYQEETFQGLVRAANAKRPKTSKNPNRPLRKPDAPVYEQGSLL